MLPIDLLQLELGDLRDAQPTAEHHQKQGAVHRMVDLGKQSLDLLAGECFGEGTPAPNKVTGLDGVPGHETPLDEKVKKVFEGMQAPMHRGRREALLLLVFQEALHVLKRYRLEGVRDGGKEEAQIKGITLDRMPGVLPPLKIGVTACNPNGPGLQSA